MSKSIENRFSEHNRDKDTLQRYSSKKERKGSDDFAANPDLYYTPETQINRHKYQIEQTRNKEENSVQGTSDFLWLHAAQEYIRKSRNDLLLLARKYNISFEECSQEIIKHILSHKSEFWLDQGTNLRVRGLGGSPSDEESANINGPESSTSHPKKRRKTQPIPAVKSNIRNITSADDFIGLRATNMRKAQNRIGHITSDYSKKLDKKLDGRLDNNDRRTLREIVTQAKQDMDDLALQLHQGRTTEALTTLSRMISDAKKVKDAFGIKYYETAINKIELIEKDRANIRVITSSDDLIGFKATNILQAKGCIHHVIDTYPNELDKKLDNNDGRTLREVIKQAKQDMDDFTSQLQQDLPTEALTTLRRMVSDAKKVKDTFGIKYYDTAIDKIELIESV